MRDPFEDPSCEDPANWDYCDEHETVFWHGEGCERCREKEARAQDNQEKNMASQDWNTPEARARRDAYFVRRWGALLRRLAG